MCVLQKTLFGATKGERTREQIEYDDDDDDYDDCEVHDDEIRQEDDARDDDDSDYNDLEDCTVPSNQVLMIEDPNLVVPDKNVTLVSPSGRQYSCSPPDLSADNGSDSSSNSDSESEYETDDESDDDDGKTIVQATQTISLSGDDIEEHSSEEKDVFDNKPATPTLGKAQEDQMAAPQQPLPETLPETLPKTLPETLPGTLPDTVPAILPETLSTEQEQMREVELDEEPAPALGKTQEDQLAVSQEQPPPKADTVAETLPSEQENKREVEAVYCVCFYRIK